MAFGFGNEKAARVGERPIDVCSTLQRAGVPREVADHAVLNGYRPRIHGAYRLTLAAAIVLGFVIASYLLPRFERLAADLTSAEAGRVGAVLYQDHFGWSVFAVIPASVCATVSLVSLLLLASAKMRAVVFLHTVREVWEWPVVGPLIVRRIEKLRQEPDPRRFVSRFVLGRWLSWAMASLVLVVISAWAVSRDLRAYSLLTERELIVSSFWPGLHRQPRAWTSASLVEVGCNHIAEKTPVDRVVFDVEWPDGAEVRLEGLVPLRMSWLEGAEIIARQLSAAGVSFRPWQWMGRDPRHPSCVAALRRRHSSDEFARMRCLLRLYDGARPASCDRQPNSPGSRANPLQDMGGDDRH